MSKNKIPNKKILILGGAGFLGANLVRHCLKESGTDVTVVDSLDPIFQSSKKSLDEILDKISFIQGDIRDKKLLEKIIPNHGVIFNCAGQTSHPLSLQNPILDAEINVMGNIRLLEAIKDYNPEAVVVYTSSSTVTGKAVSKTINEDHPERPLDIYSANKGVAEKYYRIFNRSFGLKTVAMRFANLYGPFGKKDPSFGFLNYFINLALEGKPITIYGNGEQIRNVMFVDDACEVLLLAAQSPQLIGETYFAAHHNHHSVREIAETIVKIFGGKTKFIPWPDERKRIEIDNVSISSDRLRTLINWQPKYSLEEGLKITKKRIS